jgi:hypothetical protein
MEYMGAGSKNKKNRLYGLGRRLIASQPEPFSV